MMSDFKVFFLSVFLCTSCTASKPAASSQQQTQTRVELRTETVYVPDTVYVQLPAIIQHHQTPDTLSLLENRYAKSQALIENGILSHSLELKPVREPIPIEKPTVYRDSIVYVDRFITEEVPKEITRWQRFLMNLGSLLLICILSAISYLLCRLLLR